MRTGCGETGKGWGLPEDDGQFPFLSTEGAAERGPGGLVSAVQPRSGPPRGAKVSVVPATFIYTFPLIEILARLFHLSFFCIFPPSIHHPDSTISKVLSLCFCLYLSFFNWLKYFKAKLVVIAEN